MFNRKKKIAKKISIALMSIIKPCFIPSKYIDRKGNFNPPKDFWNDSYIVSFTYVLSGLFLHFNFKGSSMNPAYKEKIISLVFSNMCGKSGKNSIDIAKKAAISTQDMSFRLGVEHSSATYSAMCGHITDSDPNPILLQARYLAKERKDLNFKTPKFLKTLNKSRNSKIGAAAIEITIMKHIKNKYLQK